MKTNNFFLTTILASSMLLACNKTQDAVTPSVQLSQATNDAIERVSNVIIDNISYDFEYAMAHLSKSDLTNKTVATSVGRDASNIFWSTNRVDMGGLSFYTNPNSKRDVVQNEIFAKLQNSSSIAELKTGLQQIESNLGNYNLDADGLKDAKLLVVMLRKFVIYFEATVMPKLPSGARVDEAYSTKVCFTCIVKCVAGTASGAVLGGLTGLGAGTVVLPVVGSVAGEVVGSIAGAVAGAVASC